MPGDTDSSRVTELLGSAPEHPPAAGELLSLVYQQLRAAAQLQMASERAEHTLQPTALVHEAFLELVGERELHWRNRRHFYAAPTEAMAQPPQPRDRVRTMHALVMAHVNLGEHAAATRVAREALSVLEESPFPNCGGLIPDLQEVLARGADGG